MKLKILVALVAGALVLGGGAFALTRLLAPAEDEAIAFAPADSIFYMNVFIRPSNSQKMALNDLVQKFPGVESVDDLIQKIVDSLDESLAESGLSYEEDLEPWVGDQMAIFAAPGEDPGVPAVAVLVESKNDAAATDFLDKGAEEDGVELEDRSYKGEDYRIETGTDDPAAALVLDGFLIFGNEDAIEAAIDTSQGEGDSLESDEAFVRTIEPLRDDWMGLFYLDFAATVDEYLASDEATAEEEQAVDLLGFRDQPPLGAVLYVTDDSVVFEASSERGGGSEALAEVGGGGVVSRLPGEAWAALGVAGVGDAASRYLELLSGIPGFDREQIDALFYGETGLRLDQDVLSWMEDAGLFVQGSNVQDVGGGLVVESNDPPKTRRVVDRLRELLAAQGVDPARETRGGLDGFSVAVPGSPGPFSVLGGERLVLAYGEDATDAAAGEGPVLGEDSEAFRAAQDAVGDDFDIAFFLDVAGAERFFVSVATFAGAPVDAYEEDWKKWVDVFTHVVYASKTEGDVVVQKFLIGVE